MTINITSISGEHVYAESGLVVVISGQSVSVSGTPVTISGQFVSITSGFYFASGLAVQIQSGIGVHIQSGEGVLVQSGYGVQVQSGLHIVTEIEPKNWNLTDSEYFELILLELRKIRTHLELLTDNEIKEQDINSE